ncbi:glutathione S-transferase family protein [Rhodoferax sp. U11-2br]|uniref:glutathione S-transferase family protein n=1 Tax=Rhodoferax sp. U11-2br TaxID=2838878 RepID=UPI001BECDE1F|nr:glutathione S-transferase [Rhodoferax sp. U11-2br]MBT3066759.1 glutathione S-transferase [Rhodoferax sp. U11-2br]
MLHIWGRLSSINVRKVVWAAQETGVHFTRTDAGLTFGVVKTFDYLRLNPNAQVPTLQDGELVLWESNVIVRYLCARYAPALYPQELAARFDTERWMDWQQTSLNPAGSQAFIQWFRTAPEQRDQSVITKSVATMTPLLILLDQHLSQRAYMGGDSFGMADIPVACDVHRWFGLPQTRPELPNLERWYAQILARPATRGVLDLPLA